jgi:hypothetical protein
LLVVVVDAVAVSAEDDALLFNFFIRGCKALAVYQFIYALLVRVVRVYVVKVEDGGV